MLSYLANKLIDWLIDKASYCDTKDAIPYRAQVCCYTTLWNINVEELPCLCFGELFCWKINSPALLWQKHDTNSHNNRFHWFWLRDLWIGLSSLCSPILTRRQKSSATDRTSFFCEEKVLLPQLSFLMPHVRTVSHSVNFSAWLIWIDFFVSGSNEDNIVQRLFWVSVLHCRLLQSNLQHVFLQTKITVEMGSLQQTLISRVEWFICIAGLVNFVLIHLSRPALFSVRARIICRFLDCGSGGIYWSVITLFCT